MSRIGFLQGRLSDLVDGKIQAFPWLNWEHEFSEAKSINLRLMEWTIDQKDLYSNPVMLESGRKKITSLCEENAVQIPSLTGDCFMQAPFWKSDGSKFDALTNDFLSIIQACGLLNIKFVIVPLVDNGKLESRKQEDKLVQFLTNKSAYLKKCNVQIAFESDYEPRELKRFINRLKPDIFGVNYDIGNSASYGYDVNDEFSYYGDRIFNVHVKDRILSGSTVPLGEGAADFDLVFRKFGMYNYTGNYMLQTARDPNNHHKEAILKYISMTSQWRSQYGA